MKFDVSYIIFYNKQTILDKKRIYLHVYGTVNHHPDINL